MFVFPQILGIRFVIIVALVITNALSIAAVFYYKGSVNTLQFELQQKQEKLDTCIENIKELDIKSEDLKEKLDALKNFYDTMPRRPSSGVLDQILALGRPVFISYTTYQDTDAEDGRRAKDRRVQRAKTRKEGNCCP
jgi:hypothetical protein